MKVKNFFKTENGRFNSPTVERIDVVIEKGFAWSVEDDEDYDEDGGPGHLNGGEDHGGSEGW